MPNQHFECFDLPAIRQNHMLDSAQKLDRPAIAGFEILDHRNVFSNSTDAVTVAFGLEDINGFLSVNRLSAGYL
jgi:hypothetical protein